MLLCASRIDPPVRRFVDRYAVEFRSREVEDDDLDGVATLLVSMGDTEAENRLVRLARRRALPVHVADRPLVSDFSLLEMLSLSPGSLAR